MEFSRGFRYQKTWQNSGKTVAKQLGVSVHYWTTLDKQNPSIGLSGQLREGVGGDGGELNYPFISEETASHACSQRTIYAKVAKSWQNYSSFLKS